MINSFRELTSAKDIRLKNVYRQIRKYPKIDINQLKEITGYKHATCVRLLEELIENKLIDDSDLGDSSGGRPPKLYKINKNINYLVGIDIGYLFIKIVLLNLNLEIVCLEKIPVDETATPEKMLKFVEESIDMFLEKKKLSREKILGVGLGILPKYDRKKIIIDSKEPFSKLGWSDFKIKEKIEEATKYQVFVESGMNLSALAEYRKQYFGNAESLLFISNDVSLKSSAIINGKFVYKGDEEINGIEHMIIDIEGNQCSCGFKGCLGTYCTLPVLEKKIKENPEIIENDDEVEITYLEMISEIDHENPYFIKERDNLAYYFGVGVSNMILQMHPDVVIIGGTLGIRMYEKIIDIVSERLLPLGLADKTVIHVMNDEFNSVSQGAGCLVFDYFIEEDNSLEIQNKN